MKALSQKAFDLLKDRKSRVFHRPSADIGFLVGVGLGLPWANFWVFVLSLLLFAGAKIYYSSLPEKPQTPPDEEKVA